MQGQTSTYFFVSSYTAKDYSQMKKIHRAMYPRNVENRGSQPINYCGIRCSIEVLGGKWKTLILSSLVAGPKRYGDLKRAIPEVSEKMLITSLRELESHGLVLRNRHPQATSMKVEYSLSEYGQSTLPLLKSLFDWGEHHIKQYSHLIFH